MLKNLFDLKANKKMHQQSYYVGATVLILLIAAISVFLIFQNNNDSGKTNRENGVTVSDQKSSTPTAPPSSPDTTKTNPSQTLQTSTPQQEVLTNCTYENGPKAGEHCPKDPPASYSQAPACYYSNPSFSGTSPSCPPYDTITSIKGSFDTASGNSYCTFSFGAGSLKSYKNIQVSNSGGVGSIPDCSVAEVISESIK